MRKGPSPHLTWKELACKDGTPYPYAYINDGRVFKLARMFESIRSMCGDEPIVVSSAYRSPTWNKKIGGARNSQHLLGCALDLVPPKGLNVTEFYNLIRANHFELGVKGLGRYTKFVHCDIRTNLDNRLVVWNGNGVKDSGARA